MESKALASSENNELEMEKSVDAVVKLIDQQDLELRNREFIQK